MIADSTQVATAGPPREEPIFSGVMTNLPPTIEVLVYAIAADAGRERAETLLMILGAGPDSARKTPRRH